MKLNRESQLRKLRHVYQLLNKVQTNGFDESLWREVLLDGLEHCLNVRHVWSGLICDKKVVCQQVAFDELALAASTHPLVQMCDQFEHRWSRSLDHNTFDVSEVLRWIPLMLDGQSDVWYQNEDMRLEKIQLAGRDVLLLTYRLNTRHLRCLMFQMKHSVLKPQHTLTLLKHRRRLMRLMILEISRMIRDSRLSTECYLATSLSPRESQTARYLLQGHTEKQMARQMYLSPHTVHTYIKSVYRHFGVSSRAEFSALFVNQSPMEHYFRIGDMNRNEVLISPDNQRTVAV